MWSARCACTRAETNILFAHVYFFADFVISSTPITSSLRDTTDRYDGEAHTRSSSAGALQRCPALAPFASSFAVLKRIVFALVTTFMSTGSRNGMPAWSSRSVSLVSTICASILPLAPGIVTWVFISSCSRRDPSK